MRLSVRLFAGLAERAGTREIVLDDLRSGLTLGELKREIETRLPRIGPLAHVAGVVGTDWVRDDRVLHERDDVSLLPPVSGGSPGAERDDVARRDGTAKHDGAAKRDDAAKHDDAALEQGVFVLSKSALDPEAIRRDVAHPSCGAIAVFIGTTRETNREKVVARLEYEAFEAMTVPEMERIFARCRGALAGDVQVRMLCAHRIGTVEVGEPSVVIAVASAHRDAAFQACRFLIDELKRTLPIWKKEIYGDGHHWIGERS
jgi:molybdopterin synthase catalytic subunit